MQTSFTKGLRDGIPIALGYLSVSFGFGILCVSLGLTAPQAVAISALNLTSAGQVAGVGIIAAAGSYFEMALTQLVINIRYSLMAISLSQKLDDSFNTPRRLLVSFGITDEIFAVASAGQGKLAPRYMYGLILISFLGWTSGTFLGVVTGNFLPESVSNAMGIVLYGMFMAIIIPASRKSRGVLTVVCIAALFGVIFRYLLTAVSGGFAIIIGAVIAAAAGALLFPRPDEPQDEEGEE